MKVARRVKAHYGSRTEAVLPPLYTGRSGTTSCALYQLDSARRSSVNQNPDSMYFTRTGPRGSMESMMFDSPEAANPRDGAAQVMLSLQEGGPRIGSKVSEALPLV